MKKELIIKKCSKCGSIIRVIEQCNCGNCEIMCCEENMNTIIPNSVDASFEKHVPTYEKKCGNIVATVNHVMNDEHYIEWICLVNDEKEEFYYLKPDSNPTVTFKDVKEGTLYSYCNKHGLWKINIE